MAQSLSKLAEAITRATEIGNHIELPEVTRQAGKLVRQLDDQVLSGTWQKVDERELEMLMRLVFDAAQIAGAEQIKRAVNELLRDPSNRKKLAQRAARANELAEVTKRVTDKLTPAEDRSLLALLVLGCAILLASGVVIPLLAGPTVEVILTNEVAIAAVAVGAAALMKKR